MESGDHFRCPCEGWAVDEAEDGSAVVGVCGSSGHGLTLEKAIGVARFQGYEVEDNGAITWQPPTFFQAHADYETIAGDEIKETDHVTRYQVGGLDYFLILRAGEALPRIAAADAASHRLRAMSLRSKTKGLPT